mmetsp:Transcript_907/g.2500  ORF Transcript_907/g.2500 Transcript_907/m.2500 type:complete len:493 (+) Transcript_907:372-1850(+)
MDAQHIQSALDVAASEPERHTPETSRFVSDVYQAVLLAASCTGGDSVQFPGRDRVLQVMKQREWLPEARGGLQEEDKAGGKGRRSGGRAGTSQYGMWRTAMDFLKQKGWIHTKPNSGTYVAAHVGTLDDLLARLNSGVTVEEDDVSAPRVRLSRSALSSSDDDEEENSSGTTIGSSEEEIAAEILLQFPLDVTSNKRAHGPSAPRKRKRQSTSQKASAAAGSAKKSPNAGAAIPTGFSLTGPWKPRDHAEEREYIKLLDELVKQNLNITYWTHSRLKKSVAAIFGVLHACPYGLPRIQLRNYARAYVGDTGLLDYTIKVLVNKELCGFYMKRETDSVTGKLLYYVASVNGGAIHRPLAQPQMEKENEAPTSESSGGVIASEEDEGREAHQRAGKRKVAAPKRFEDYMKPPKKRSGNALAVGGQSNAPGQQFAQQHLPPPPPPLPPALGVTTNKMIFNNINSCTYAETVGLSQDMNKLREQLKHIPITFTIVD